MGRTSRANSTACAAAKCSASRAPGISFQKRMLTAIIAGMGAGGLLVPLARGHDALGSRLLGFQQLHNDGALLDPVDGRDIGVIQTRRHLRRALEPRRA